MICIFLWGDYLGSAYFDLAVAEGVYRKATALGIGLDVEV